MAKKIIWSIRAENDLIAILTYWRNRNKSNTYSIKLNKLIKETIEIISEFPEIGKNTVDKTARIKNIGNYQIIYETFQTKIVILTIWDARQYPNALNIL